MTHVADYRIFIRSFIVTSIFIEASNMSTYTIISQDQICINQIRILKYNYQKNYLMLYLCLVLTVWVSHKYLSDNKNNLFNASSVIYSRRTFYVCTKIDSWFLSYFNFLD